MGQVLPGKLEGFGSTSPMLRSSDLVQPRTCLSGLIPLCAPTHTLCVYSVQLTPDKALSIQHAPILAPNSPISQMRKWCHVVLSAKVKSKPRASPHMSDIMFAPQLPPCER